MPTPTTHNLNDKQWPSLILVLIYEYLRGPDSPWYSYLQVLPQEGEFDTLIWWDVDQLHELQASAIKDKIGRADAFEMFYNEIFPVIEGNQDVFDIANLSEGCDRRETSERLISLANRMASTIMAYAFDIECNDNEKYADEDGYITDEEEANQQKAMLPMADMLNADAKFNAHLYNDSDGLIMRSIRDIQKGEEILNDFGPLPRSELLRRYGYVTNSYAKYDVVEIPLDLIMQQIKKNVAWEPADIENRLECFEEDGIAQEGFIIDRGDPADIEDNDVPPDVEIVPELFALVQGMLAEPSVWKKWHKKLDSEKQASLRSRACALLHRVFEQRLSQYDTTEEDDQTILQSDKDTTQRKQMAVQVRLGEKLLLREAKLQLLNQFAKPSSDVEEPALKRQRTA